jgi:O-antigen/teichoic acid export membrane protein
MAAIVCITNLLSYLTLYILAKRQWPDIVFSFRKVTVASIKELAEYCFSLSIWAIGLLLVTGLDLSVVGYYRFNEVAYYSLAATIVTFLGGFYNAIISPMMPAAAALHARGDHKTLSHMVTVTTRYGMVLLLGTGIPLILGIHPILQLWVGLAYTSHTATIAVMLIIANIIRLSITPYVAAMIGSGEQRLAILTPLIEGISNLGFSAIAGYYLGALGVAFGTLFGALIGLAGMLFYNMPRTSIQVNIKQYFSGSLLRPCISIVPALAFLLIKSFNGAQNSLIDYSLRIAALTTGLALLWRVGLTDSERDRLATRLNLRLRTTV